MRLPMWAKWVLSFTVSAVLLVALVVFVDHHNTDNLAVQSPQALARANREADIVVAQDQSPHVLAVTSGESPRRALVGAVRADMTARIDKGAISGPLQRAGCTGHGRHAGALRFTCVATSAGSNYNFAALVDVTAKRLTYCRRDVAPVPGQTIPLSRRCTG
jgi:hypothetical protein